MPFKQRIDAAYKLAHALKKYHGCNGVVLAIPRGGLPIANIISNILDFKLDIMLAKKIGHPLNKEFAIGSVSMQRIMLGPSVSADEEYLRSESIRIYEDLLEKYKRFMENRKPATLKNKIVIIVDDGIATGNTMLGVIQVVKKMEPEKLIVAVPVAPADSIPILEQHADEVVCLLTPENFQEVGQFYEDFSEVTDEEVIHILEKAATREQKSNSRVPDIGNKGKI